jgi:hypothetical protein
LLPAYEIFAAKSEWGDPSLLRGSLDAAWGSFLEPVEARVLLNLANRCREWLPDTETFGSQEAGMALEAGIAVIRTLHCGAGQTGGEAGLAAEAMMNAIDILLMEEFDRSRKGPRPASLAELRQENEEFERFVGSHPLMLAELRKEKEEIAELQTWDAIEAGPLDRFRRSARYSMLTAAVDSMRSW